MGKSKTSNHSVKRWPLGLAFALALVAIVAFSGGGASVTQNVHGAVYDWAGANPGQDVPILVQTDG